VSLGRAPAVLLISPGIIQWSDMDFGLPHLVSLGGYLRAHLGVRVELLDLSYEGGDQGQLERRLDELSPYLLIGLSCYSSFDYLRVLSLGRYLHQRYPEIPLVSGGYHASALPEDLLFEGGPFQAVILGEAEIPLARMVEKLLGGDRIEPGIYGPEMIPQLDNLPPYDWSLLDRYWPRAESLGRKFQIYLSRGCPHHCSFCMERSKSGYQWRAYSPARALEELERLSKRIQMKAWIINLADPLFGMAGRWRREVLEGILKRGLLPRQYWTLTRSEDLQEPDVELLAKARFSIGIGVESGDPEMLRRMQKSRRPEAYLEALERLARLSLKHGLNWAGNVIVGHPGENLSSMRQTQAFMERLFTRAEKTCGWLSIDPFRLYPGSQIHEEMEAYSAEYGCHFYHPEWWKRWYNGPFCAEHIDPSDELSFQGRVGEMYRLYAPLIQRISQRFEGQGHSIDRVFHRALQAQEELMSPRSEARLLSQAQAVLKLPKGSQLKLSVPIGLQIKNPRVRRREEAIRALLEEGVLRSERLLEALLQVSPEDSLSLEESKALLAGRISPPNKHGLLRHLGLRHYVLGLEAMAPSLGDRVVDLSAESAYLSILLRQLVGAQGEVLSGHPSAWPRLKWRRAGLRPVRVDPSTGRGLKAPFDALWITGALPWFPKPLAALLHPQGGRAITWLGPRFRDQEMLCLSRQGAQINEATLARLQLPPLRGAAGWIRR